MTPEIAYPIDMLSGPLGFEPTRVWAIAASLRRQIQSSVGDPPNTVEELGAALPSIAVNGAVIAIAWDFRNSVHDDDGNPVLGVCETDPDDPSSAYVSVNGPLLSARPDLMLSTAAHELGHAVFDVPAMLQNARAAGRRLRVLTPSLAALAHARDPRERRANEFMGGFLARPFAVHRELLRRAREDGLPLARAPHLGRPAWPIVSGDSDPDSLAGLIDVLSQDFGVSPAFMSVRLQRYGFISTNKTGART